MGEMRVGLRAGSLDRTLDADALAGLRQDLGRCIARADTLGLSVVALQLQHALDELIELAPGR